MTRKALVWLCMSCTVVFALGCDNGDGATSDDFVCPPGYECRESEPEPQSGGMEDLYAVCMGADLGGGGCLAEGLKLICQAACEYEANVCFSPCTTQEFAGCLTFVMEEFYSLNECASLVCGFLAADTAGDPQFCQ